MSVVGRQALMGGQEEYASRLFNFLVPQMLVGFKEMLDNATVVCDASGEPEKYLMTFQNYLAGVPEWSAAVVEKEGQRIRAASGCGYLEELLACVHVAHLKLLTAIRPGERSQEVQLDMPSFDQYVHNAYSGAARHLYRNTFLFERDTTPLDRQKNMREVEVLLQRGSMDALREGLPVEGIIRSYLAEREELEGGPPAAVQPMTDKPVAMATDKPVAMATDKPVAMATDKPVATTMTDKPVAMADKPVATTMADKPVATDEPVMTGETVVRQPAPVKLVTAELAATPSVAAPVENVVIAHPAGGVSFSRTDAVLDMGTNVSSNVEVSKTIEAIEVRNAVREATERDEGLLQISTEPASASADLGVEILA
jgi:hypothetical protein